MKTHPSSSEVSVRCGLVRGIKQADEAADGPVSVKKQAGACYLSGCATVKNPNLAFECFSPRNGVNTPGARSSSWVSMPSPTVLGPAHRYSVTTHDQVVFSNKNTDGIELTVCNASQLQHLTAFASLVAIPCAYGSHHDIGSSSSAALTSKLIFSS